MHHERTFPGLAELGLTQVDLDALARQGFVAPEKGCSGHRRFKLRFRMDGKQVVRYIGTDPIRAARIERELEILQCEHRSDRQLQRQLRMARAALRESKRILAPVLQEMGYQYHGYAIRRPRACVD